MQATVAGYHASTARTRLIATALALAGSGTMVAGNLSIAAHYAASSDATQLKLASRDNMPRQTAAIKCTGNAS